MVVRASVTAKDRMVFDWYIPVEAGMSPDSLVAAVRRFFGLIRAALEEDRANVLK